MNYSELIQLYFDRSNALQNYWTLYVVIIGGLLAVSAIRKQPSILTTAIVSVLFALFAYENLGAIQETAAHRFAVLDSIKASPATAPDVAQLRETLEPRLRPASHTSTALTHIIADVLTIAALWTMELRRRKFHGANAAV
jgi:hypothetical protein